MSESKPSLDSIVVAALAEQYGLDAGTVARALQLLADRTPIPYLARYRREAVGGLDEATLRDLRVDAEHVRALEQRREFILRAISEREGVSEKVRRRIERSRDRLELEYLYEPYRPPRKTPGSLARERGLGELADAIRAGGEFDAAAFVNAERDVPTVEAALEGACEVLAEQFAVDPEVRGTMLRVVEKSGVVGAMPAHGRKEIPQRYGPLRSLEERLARIPSHRFLALRRAEQEGGLALRVSFPEEKVLASIAQRFFPSECADAARALLDRAAAETVRLLRPAVFEDALQSAKRRADREAIGVLSRNLHDLLLFPPAGPRRVLGVDPAPRGPIPLACVDERGEHLEHARLRFFGKDEKKIAAARAEVRRLVTAHRVELVAVGNGQGRHQCEEFLRDTLEELGEEAPPIVVVNEVGASAYASGPVGRVELPALPVPVRGAVSLGRRLQDPLSELVKADPRQLGGGQHAGEIDAARLGRALDEVVESAVAAVGVDLNTASASLLGRVCGISMSVARQIVEHRERSGRFPTRAALQELPFVTERAWSYAAGFLRVRGGENPLDAIGIHPALEPVVARIAAAVGSEPAALIGDADAISAVDVDRFADENASPAAVAGMLCDLVAGDVDPRPPLEIVRRPPGVRTAADLREGMRLAGRVTNVTNFGAFVDVGVQQDGLVHVSQLADHFVKDATSVAHVGQTVQVRVLGVDGDTGRISLSMKSDRPPQRRSEGRGGARRPRSEGGGRPRRGEPRRPRRDEEAPERAPEPVAAEAPVVPETLPEDPIPTDMSEEEFMQKKLEELRRRFG